MASKVISALDSVVSRLASIADDATFDYQNAVVYLSWAQTSFEIYIMRRQIPCYAIPRPPPELAAHLKQDTYDKAQRYGRDKIRFQLLKTVFNQCIGYAFIKLGVYAWGWEISAKAMDAVGLAQNRVILHSLLWMTLLALISGLPGLPWDYYYTFVLEQQHGFNKSTRGLWVGDTLKTYALTAALGLPVLAGFLKIIELTGKSFVPWLMLFMISVQLSLQIVFPIFIQPLFNKFTPVPQGEVRTRVENLARKLGFPLKHLYVIDGSKRSSHSNAYFYGLPWSKQIVIYDTLIDKSTPAEVEAVLAHELGHWHFAHPTRLLLITQLHLLFTLIVFSVFIHNKALFASFGFDQRLAVESPIGGPQPIVIGFMLYQLLFEPLDTIAKFLMNAQTRSYEYQADEFAVQLGKKDELASALIKLHVDNLSSPHSDEFYSMYHHSHPTLPERLRAMDEYAGSERLAMKPAEKEKEKKEQ